MQPKTAVSFTRTNASLFLDVVRGLAACIVVLEHWRNFIFVDYPELTAHRGLFAIPYLLCSAGHQAVVIFFVLSGFLISGSISRMLQNGTWNWTTYLTHRLMRLWVVLLPGLLLCLLWDSIGMHFNLAPNLYAGNINNHMSLHVAQRLSVKIFFENLLFLQGILTHTFGSDVALWSLANEFWYYILFPLGLFAIRRTSKPMERVVTGGLFLLTAYFVGHRKLELFPIWLAGALLCVMPPLNVGRGVRRAATVLYVMLIFFCSRQHWIALTPLQSDYLLTVGTFLFLWVLLSATDEAKPSFLHDAGRTLARFSFTLYVSHVPLLVLMVALIPGDERWSPTGIHMLQGLGILIIVFAYAYGVAALTEFNTDRWRRWVEKKLHIAAQDTSTVVTRS